MVFKLDLRDFSYKKSLLCPNWGKETSHMRASNLTSPVSE